MGVDLESLERHPDIDTPELKAYDATDVLLLERAAELTDNFRELTGREIVVVGERHGAITLSLTLPETLGGFGLTGVRVYQDELLHEHAMLRNNKRMRANGSLDIAEPHIEQHRLGPSLFEGAGLVLLQLPKSLDALAEIAYWVQAYADPSVVLVAGGRVKHMTLSQNEVLAKYFAHVEPQLAERKSRLIIASGPLGNPADPPFPVTGTDPDLDFTLHAYGATFGGATLDHGTRLMLAHLADIAPHARHIVDLGSGNGSLAVAVARARPDAEVIATDQSWAAFDATTATARWAGVADRVTVHRADACTAVSDGWADLILLNPPFHSGQIVSEEVAHRLIRSTVRALAPGGTLLVVYNSHLGHRRVIEAAVGPVTQVARDRTFTLVRATRGVEPDDVESGAAESGGVEPGGAEQSPAT